MQLNSQTFSSVHGTQEWAKKTINIMNGCPNDCKYCYAKSIAIRFKRNSADDWKYSSLKNDALNNKFKKLDGRYMFPSAHDITLENLEYCKTLLSMLLETGNEILIVTKPDFLCIKNICDHFLEFQDKIVFRFTIGSLNDEVLGFWEPNAPSFLSRLESLEYAAKLGYQTSVSCEPYLDDKIIELIERLREYVTDSIWIGKANRLKSIISMNDHKDELTQLKVDQLLNLYNSGYSQKLYDHYKDDPIIKWKDSLKKEFGIPLAQEIGLDQ